MKRLAAVLVVLGVFALPGAALAQEGPHKAYVCKYVGTPGDDERLQTGNNPIEVDTNALEGKGFAGSFPFEFSDAQGRSIAIGFVGEGFPVLGRGDCPQPDNPPDDELSITIDATADCEGYEAEILIEVREGHLWEVTAPGFFEEGQATSDGVVSVIASGPQTSGSIIAINFGENKPSHKADARADFEVRKDCETPPPPPPPPPPPCCVPPVPPPPVPPDLPDTGIGAGFLAVLALMLTGVGGTVLARVKP